MFYVALDVNEPVNMRLKEIVEKRVRDLGLRLEVCLILVRKL